MKIFNHKFKFLNLVILLLIVLIPILLYAAAGDFFVISNNSTSLTTYPRDPNNSANLLTSQGTCFTNSSGNDYFLPNKTWAEWNAFFTHMPSGVSISSGCCVNGKCEGSETCANCSSDCGACWKCGDNIVDPRDGNIYPTVKEGTQCWMAKNLAYLPSVVPALAGQCDATVYYVYGYNGYDVATAKAQSNYSDYGVLYGQGMAEAACPSGWHLPSDSEFALLENRFGGVYTATTTDTGYKLMATGTSYWISPNTSATNISGFNVRGGGYNDSASHFYSLKSAAYFMVDSGADYSSYYRNITSAGRLYRTYTSCINGSVRCVSNTALPASTKTLTYIAGPNGSVTGNLSQTIVEGSSGTSVTATPNSQDYVFVNWSDGSTAATRTDTNVISDLTVTANFSNLVGCGTCGLSSTGITCPNNCSGYGGAQTLTGCSKIVPTHEVCRQVQEGTYCFDVEITVSDTYYWGKPSAWKCN